MVCSSHTPSPHRANIQHDVWGVLDQTKEPVGTHLSVSHIAAKYCTAFTTHPCAALRFLRSNHTAISFEQQLRGETTMTYLEGHQVYDVVWRGGGYELSEER
jgi:hypothetical protein